MDILDDRNPFSEAGATAVSSSPNQGSFRDGMTTRQLEEFDSSYSNVRKCVNCGQDKKLSDFPMSFRKAKQCRFCVVLKKRGLLCMPSDIVAPSEEFSAPQQQEPSSPGRNSNSSSHSRRGSLNITPTLTKSLRNLLNKGDAALAPPLMTYSVPNAQYV